LSWPPVDVMKMNIEGSELAALRGMRQLSNRNPQLQLVMEFNPTAMARAHVTRMELRGTLTDLGFRSGRVVERGLQEIANDELVPDGGVVYNVLLAKQ